MRAAVAALLLAWGLAANAAAVVFAVMGDTPYSDFERRQFPAMLEAATSAGVDFVAHVGDIKRSRDPCDDGVFADRRAVFDASRVPFVLVPGDNEWTDCHRLPAGGHDPLERLGALRRIFWSSDQSLGQRRLTLERQSADYPEHARFRAGPVLVVSLNVPGGGNNWGMDVVPTREYRSRNAAVLAWLREGFTLARRQGLPGIVILMHADPDFRHFARGMAARGYGDLLRTLRSEVAKFKGQVLLVHGDTHHHIIDKPLTDAAGRPLANFTRLETYGYPTMGWVKVVADPDLPGLFTFRSHPWP